MKNGFAAPNPATSLPQTVYAQTRFADIMPPQCSYAARENKYNKKL
jgi:hypothetical protein